MADPRAIIDAPTAMLATTETGSKADTLNNGPTDMVGDAANRTNEPAKTTTEPMTKMNTLASISSFFVSFRL
ncbi:MAG: hypothetical protein U5J64_08910 [Halobacteriales archaeon]|nr:hypothetical protein [Halobacteriales archaeon]